LPIADYINKAFNIVHFGSRNWWYDWDKAFYTYDAEDIWIQREIADIMRIVGDGNFYKYNGNSITDTSTIIHLASTVDVYTTNPFNKHTGYINARNGVLKIDYKNRIVTKIGKNPKYMFSYCIDTDFDPTIVDTEIHEMLGQNLGNAQRDLIYQMAAIAIRDTDPELLPSKIACLLIGPRNTGKNVVMKALDDFFGKSIVSHIPLLEIAENKFVKPLLEGKVINLDDELPDNLPLTESRELKSLTGGKFHTLEPKNVKPYEGVITALLVFAGNQFPKCNIKRSDTAFWDRLEIIHFNREQHSVDEDYIAKLLTPHNLTGFFNRVIEKLFFIHEHKITRQSTGDSAFREWMYNTSSVYQFLEDMTIPCSTTCEYERHTFHEYYLAWCKKRKIDDIDICKTLYSFGQELGKVWKIKETQSDVDYIRTYQYKIMRDYIPELLDTVKNLDDFLESDTNESDDGMGADPRFTSLYVDPFGVMRSYEDDQPLPKEFAYIDADGNECIGYE
jgi:phage/plasmid-associated DNA primase